jgi:hypothetical protein
MTQSTIILLKVGYRFGEYNAPCWLKMSLVDFDKEQAGTQASTLTFVRLSGTSEN